MKFRDSKYQAESTNDASRRNSTFILCDFFPAMLECDLFVGIGA